MADVQAKAANDPLHARCLVLDDGKTKLAIVVVDSCMMPARARRRTPRPGDEADRHPGRPHPHLGDAHAHRPDVTGVFQSEPDAEYVKFLPTKIAEGIKTAHEPARPARSASAGAKDEPRSSTAAGSASTA